MQVFANPAADKLSNAIDEVNGVNVLPICPIRSSQLSPISNPMNTPPRRSTRITSLNIRFCNSTDFRWCNTRIAVTDENRASPNGSCAPSPQTISTPSLCPFAFHAFVERTSYSSAVTRSACRRKNRVPAPYPAPISSACSPSCCPANTQGNRCCSEKCLHIEEEQTKCSKEFMGRGNSLAQPNGGGVVARIDSVSASNACGEHSWKLGLTFISTYVDL